MTVDVIFLTSGDVAFRVLERIKSVGHRAMQGTLTENEEDTHIYVCDINPNMLNVGKKRAAERGLEHQLCNYILPSLPQVWVTLFNS
jgi:ubiquinone/menaquinone biosynthesis C-methylase UbiE